MSLLKLVSLSVVLSNLVGVSPVKLERLEVPPVIQNGTVEHVVLDCPYTLEPGERDGIVLKWYLNSNTVPIYQWIPPSHPQGLGSMRHRIDLDYEISADPWKRHRALYLLRPGVEMSGMYTCKVSTLENEVQSSRTMIVYTPPRYLNVGTVRASYSSVNVSCVVEHTFPRPGLILYRSHTRGSGGRVKVAGARQVVDRYRDGAYRVLVWAVLEDAALQLENLFECEMFLPQTDFRLSKSTIYSPRQPAVLARSNTFSSQATQRLGVTSSLLVTLLVAALVKMLTE